MGKYQFAQPHRQRVLRSTIILNELPQAVRRFLEKNEDYRDGSDEFGPIAQVMDMSRKYKKILSVVRDGETLTGEPLEEVVQDMIGHCLLLLEQLRHSGSRNGGTYEFTSVDWSSHYMAAMVKMVNELSDVQQDLEDLNTNG